ATPEYRLCHHDGWVNDDAKIDGAERQEVCWDLEDIHKNEGRHHGERNRDGDDQGAARTSEENDQDNENEGNSPQNGMRDLAGCSVDAVRAIVIGHGPDVLRRQAFVELSDFSMPAKQYL